MWAELKGKDSKGLNQAMVVIMVCLHWQSLATVVVLYPGFCASAASAVVLKAAATGVLLKAG